MSTVKLSTGERIAILRGRKKMTQMQLAAAAGLRQRTHVARIESGEIARPEDETLQGIAAALGVSVDFLLGQGDPPPPPADEPFDFVSFGEDLIEVPIMAEMACGEPMDYAVQGESVKVPRAFAPDKEIGEYLVRARGDSMEEFGILDGDYVVIEEKRGKVVAYGDVVVAWYDTGITIKVWTKVGNDRVLMAGKAGYPSYVVKEGVPFEIQGIVRRSWRLNRFFSTAHPDMRRNDHAAVTERTARTDASSVPSTPASSPTRQAPPRDAEPIGLGMVVEDDDYFTGGSRGAVEEREVLEPQRKGRTK